MASELLGRMHALMHELAAQVSGRVGAELSSQVRDGLEAWVGLGVRVRSG